MPSIGFKHSKKSKEQMRLSALGNSTGGMSGKHHTEESKQKNKEKHLGKIPWNKGMHDPNAKRNQIKQPREKRTISESTRQKLIDSHKGKPSPRKGVHLSEATKQKLSISHILPDDEKPRVKKICKNCNIEFEVTPSRDNYGYGVFHSKQCQLEYQVKENSPQWKGGISPLRKLIQEQPEYIAWRIAVFERDDYKDWFSGCKGDLAAHHIIKFADIIERNNIKTVDDALNCAELWDINNGITMLKKSHKVYHDMWGW